MRRRKVELSVCIPCYNAEKELLKCYYKISKVLRSSSYSYEIIFAQDGSKDRTEELGLELAKQKGDVIFLSFPRRMGKGFGLKNCFKLAKGKYLIVYDVDCPVDAEMILRIVEFAEEKGYDIVLARRKFLNYPPLRKFASRAYLLLTKILFHHKFKDVQAGFKLIRKEVVDEIKLKSNGFALDTELLVKALRKKFRIGEIEVEWWYSRESSTISSRIIRTSFKMFKEVLKIWLSLLHES